MSQLERELIRERVRAGMRNAKAKGVKVGRVRKRNDVLIHSLLDAQLSFREIAKIAKCSHGSVSAAKKEWLSKNEEMERRKFDEITKAMALNSVSSTLENLKATNMPEEMVQRVQEKLQSDAKENVRSTQGQGYETYD